MRQPGLLLLQAGEGDNAPRRRCTGPHIPLTFVRDKGREVILSVMPIGAPGATTVSE